MTALAATGSRQSRGVMSIRQFPVNALSVIYKGGFVTLDTDGYARPGTDTASYLCAGVALEDKTGGAADGDVWVTVGFGCDFLFTASSITQAMLNTSPAMYLVDDNTVDDAAGATNDVFVGLLVQFESTTSGWVYVPGPISPAATLSGITASAAEINALDITGAGTAQASKAVVLDSNLQVLGIRRGVALAEATGTLTAARSGELIVCAVDAVITLPAAAAATEGVWYTISCGVASGGTGLSISPNASDHIRGNGLTSVDNKDLINTAATDAIGDSATIVCDGVDGWVIVGQTGIWAKEA